MPTYFHFWYDNPHRPNDEVIFNGQLESHRCSYIMTNRQQCKRRCVIGLPCCHSHLPVKYHIEVKNSLIPHSGKGIFVIDKSRPAGAIIFREGDNICPYYGELINQATLDRRYGPRQPNNPENELTAPYAVGVNRGQYEDAALKRGVGSLINHKPRRLCNCRLGNPNAQNHISIKAITNIRNGEELYLDYGNAYRLHTPYLHYDTNHRKYY